VRGGGRGVAFGVGWGVAVGVGSGVAVGMEASSVCLTDSSSHIWIATWVAICAMSGVGSAGCSSPQPLTRMANARMMAFFKVRIPPA
jgi:hypothetical protein